MPERVFIDSDIHRARLIAEALRQAGIANYVRNEFLSGALGDLPPQEVWPEVWIIDDRDDAAARRIVADLTVDVRGGSVWRCTCGEALEAQFTHCWHCGAAAPS